MVKRSSRTSMFWPISSISIAIRAEDISFLCGKVTICCDTFLSSLVEVASFSTVPCFLICAFFPLVTCLFSSFCRLSSFDGGESIVVCFFSNRLRIQRAKIVRTTQVRRKRKNRFLRFLRLFSLVILSFHKNIQTF